MGNRNSNSQRLCGIAKQGTLGYIALEMPTACSISCRDGVDRVGGQKDRDPSEPAWVLGLELLPPRHRKSPQVHVK